MPLAPPTAPEKIYYKQPFRGQVFILVSGGAGTERDILVASVNTVRYYVTFKKDGAPKEVTRWEALIIFGTNQRVSIGNGEFYMSGASGKWHPPTPEEATWPGVREALIASGEIGLEIVEVETRTGSDPASVIASVPKAPVAVPGPRPRGAAAPA